MFGAGASGRLGEEAAALAGGGRALLVTDKGIVAAGIAGPAAAQLPGVEIFDEVEPNPRHATVDRAGALARRLKPSLIVGLGGGSALDAAKAVALLATNPGSIADYEGRAKYKNRPLPVLAVPTTCGTGSEVTWVAVITHTGRRFKMSVKGPEMFPAAAVVDPDLLLTLPRPLIGSTGMDALTHAVEAATVRPATPFTDLFAREAVRLLFGHLRAAHQDIGAHRESREKVMLASVLAGFAFGNSDVGAVHCLSEAIGSLFDTPHGEANAVFLPWVMEFNLPVSGGRFADLARAAGLGERDGEGAALRLIEEVRALSRALGIPAFKDLGIGPEHFREIAEKSTANNSNPSNARAAGVEDYLDILRRAAS
ncbi:MAG: iron-containing alcohol dehydrogenase [Candidatus Aminicenantes bacterium]|nr:iron-containing alcohol dehydrogenase [Candidatus Aminicenantes bacterium]